MARTLLTEQAAVLVEGGGGVGGLVGVDADHHRHAGTCGLALTQSLGVPAGTAATIAYQLARPDAVERIVDDRLRYRLLLRPQATVRPD